MRGKYRGHYYSQLNHQRIALVMSRLGAAEAAALLKLHVLAGMSRQQFDLTDGSFSVSGHKMRREDVAGWLAGCTPGLSYNKALAAVDALVEVKELAVQARSGVVRLACWGREQSESPTAGAVRQEKSRMNARVKAVRESLAKVSGQVLEADDLLFRVQGAASCAPVTAGKILKVLSGAGEVVPRDGGLLVCVVPAKPNTVAPSALPAPHEVRGAIAHEDEYDMTHPDGCDMSQSLNNNHTHKRDANASHDHDGRAPGYGRGHERGEPPTGSLRSPAGSRFDEDEGGAGSAEGARGPRFQSGGARGIDIWAVPAGQLIEAAMEIFNPEDRAKNRGIMQSKISQLNRAFGPQRAGQIFRELVSAVQTDVLCRGKLQHPEREFYKRVNEAIEENRKAGCNG